MPFAVVQATFWDHGGTTFTPVPKATWDAVAAEMGKKRSATVAGSVTDAEGTPTPNGFGLITLQRHQAGWLVTAQPVGGTKPVWLTDPARGSSAAALGCCGSAKVPGKYIVADAPAVAAAKHFFATGACHPELKWADQPPA
jgi:hypothetical protein